jgi:hypothetical protein
VLHIVEPAEQHPSLLPGLGSQRGQHDERLALHPHAIAHHVEEKIAETRPGLHQRHGEAG